MWKNSINIDGWKPSRNCAGFSRRSSLIKDVVSTAEIGGSRIGPTQIKSKQMLRQELESNGGLWCNSCTKENDYLKLQCGM